MAGTHLWRQLMLFPTTLGKQEDSEDSVYLVLYFVLGVQKTETLKSFKI